MLKLFFITGVACLTLTGSAAAQRCLHDANENASDRQRRLGTIAIIHEITAAQRRLERERGSYVPLEQAIATNRIPIGFVLRLTTDRWGYAVVAKDTLDPCRFSLFSDHEGVVYEGHPVAAGGTEGAPQPPD